jgi:hypothetical protein
MNVELINPAVTPMLACGPSFSGGFIAIILAVFGVWILAGVAAVSNLFMAAARKGNELRLHLGILGTAAVLGGLAYEHVGGAPIFIVGAIGAPVLMFAQFAYLVKSRRRSLRAA